MLVPTPHNEAKKGDIANIVIMPGDPLRAEYIANKFLSDVVCYNKVRNMYGFTGKYKGMKISIQASGMGIPSMGIYSKELFDGYDVDVIIRVGSAGSLVDNIKLRDIVVSESVGSDSNYLNLLGLDSSVDLAADEQLLNIAKNYESSKIANKLIFGKTFTSILFYNGLEGLKKVSNEGYLAVEMETLALYANAKLSNKKALSIFTISDNPLTGEALSSKDRQCSFNEMVEIALDVALKYQNERNKND